MGKIYQVELELFIKELLDVEKNIPLEFF